MWSNLKYLVLSPASPLPACVMALRERERERERESAPESTSAGRSAHGERKVPLQKGHAKVQCPHVLWLSALWLCSGLIPFLTRAGVGFC
jgi:hypothetical protein